MIDTMPPTRHFLTHSLAIPGLSVVSALSLTATAGAAPAITAEDAFYTPPVSVPGTAGTLIRSQPVAHPLDDSATGEGPARADRILYTSTTEDGTPVATSGFIMEPAGAWQGGGPTPTIVFAPGTRGTGDTCAPSRAKNLLAGTDPTSGARNINYEYPFYAMASAQGFRVIVTDYIGLGTPGQHTYVNHTEEGHAVLDAARAGLAFAGAAPDSPVAFFGYSQGGGASAGAAELASSYAPELNLVGTFAGAPPADLLAVTDTVDGSLSGGKVVGFALNGAIARHPELAEVEDRYFNEAGREFLAETKESCLISADTGVDMNVDIDSLGERLRSLGPGSATSGDHLLDSMRFNSRDLTVDGRSFSEIIRDDDQLRGILTGPNYHLGNRTPTAPVFILGGIHDDIIPYGQTRQLAVDYCAAGGTVTFVTDRSPATVPEGTGLGHARPLVKHVSEALSWLADRFNGKDAPDNCGDF